MSTTIPKPTHVLILGAGFGGTYTALHLERLLKDDEAVQITLVSRDNYFLMTPLLFEAGSGVLEPRHAVTPLRQLLRRTRFVEGDVTGIDLDRRLVFATPAPGQAGYELPYDQLVIALGGVTNRALVKGSEHAMTFKALADAIFLRNHVIDLFERADVEQDPQRKRQLLTFVIVGAGLVGVELMGELTSFIRRLCEPYPRVSCEEVRLELIEAGPKFLPEMDEHLAQYAAEVLRDRGVNIRMSAPVESLEPGKVNLPGGETIPAATIILATGVAPNPLLASVAVEKGRKGQIVVDAAMRVPGRPGVWAIGDCAQIPDPQGKPYPPLAQHALREAKVLAGNIAATLRGREEQIRPFVYQTLGTLAALGHYSGVGRIKRFRFHGFVAWWIWRTYYLLQMPRWSRRIRIMLDWTVALFFKTDIVKLDLFGQEHPLRRVAEERPATSPAPPSSPELVT